MSELKVYKQPLYNFSKQEEKPKVSEFPLYFSKWVNTNTQKAFNICESLKVEE